MEIRLNINKSVEQNAEIYFEKAKKLKKKIPGIKKTIEFQKEKLAALEKKSARILEQKEQSSQQKVKKEWYHKFRWFISSEGFLIVGGRDATTNEILIKKYMEKTDLVFHTELAGSPFVLIKNPETKELGQQTIDEAAQFCASYSKSWQAGRTTAEVYYINPDQVSRTAQSGEYLPKGSFMVYGKRTFINARINIALCNHAGSIMAGPIFAITHHSKIYVEIVQEKTKISDTAKKIQKVIGGDLDEIIRCLPPDSAIKKKR